MSLQVADAVLIFIGFDWVAKRSLLTLNVRSRHVVIIDVWTTFSQLKYNDDEAHLIYFHEVRKVDSSVFHPDQSILSSAVGHKTLRVNSTVEAIHADYGVVESSSFLFNLSIVLRFFGKVQYMNMQFQPFFLLVIIWSS